MMSNILVAYFSATGKTAKLAEKLAASIGADIYEIKPEMKYTKADLNWMNRKSRSSVEMNSKSFRPAIITGDVDVSTYDTIYLGFPIWWYVAPTVINTFLETYDFTGKKIVLFATSGSSGFGNTVAELRPSAPGAEIVEAKVLSGIITEAKIRALIDNIYLFVPHHCKPYTEFTRTLNPLLKPAQRHGTIPAAGRTVARWRRRTTQRGRP